MKNYDDKKLYKILWKNTYHFQVSNNLETLLLT
jgi:hypothetical protein